MPATGISHVGDGIFYERDSGRSVGLMREVPAQGLARLRCRLARSLTPIVDAGAPQAWAALGTQVEAGVRCAALG